MLSSFSRRRERVLAGLILSNGPCEHENLRGSLGVWVDVWRKRRRRFSRLRSCFFLSASDYNNSEMKESFIRLTLSKVRDVAYISL